MRFVAHPQPVVRDLFVSIFVFLLDLCESRRPAVAPSMLAFAYVAMKRDLRLDLSKFQVFGGSSPTLSYPPRG